MNTVYIREPEGGALREVDDVIDIMTTTDTTIRALVAPKQEERMDGILFKGEGRFKVWVQSEHRDGVITYENSRNPTLRPNSVIEVERSDGIDVSLKGRLMRLKAT